MFDENSNGKFTPRSLHVDLTSGTCDYVRAGPLGGLFRPDNLISDKSSVGSGGMFSKAFFLEGAEMADSVMDAVRRETERCDCLHGFQFMRSLGGGTGSGIGSLLAAKIREEFPDRIISDFAIFGSPKVSDSVVEPYNSILAMHHMIENVDQVYCIDNSSLLNQATQKLGIQNPRYSDLNRFATQMMSGITSSLRFPSHLMSDLRKQAVCLTPYPRQHFLIPSEVPLSDPELSLFDIRQSNVKTFAEMVQELLEPSSTLVDVDLRAGRLISAHASFRGAGASLFEAFGTLSKLEERDPARFAQTFPMHWNYSFSSKAPPGLETSATLVQNSTSIISLLERVKTQFDTIFKRKAFLRPYLQDGMDELEFLEAACNVGDLIAEYQQWEFHTDDISGDQ